MLLVWLSFNLTLHFTVTTVADNDKFLVLARCWRGGSVGLELTLKWPQPVDPNNARHSLNTGANANTVKLSWPMARLRGHSMVKWHLYVKNKFCFTPLLGAVWFQSFFNILLHKHCQLVVCLFLVALYLRVRCFFLCVSVSSHVFCLCLSLVWYVCQRVCH